MKTIHLAIFSISFSLALIVKSAYGCGGGFCMGVNCPSEPPCLPPTESIVIDILVASAVIGCCYFLFRRYKEK